MKKICFFTSTRSDYGLLLPILRLFKESDKFDLQIIVTGMHLESDYGYTYKQIEEDGFKIDFRVSNILNEDNEIGVLKSTALGVLGYAEALKILDPDLIFILGDRFEMLAAAYSSFIYGIPICHYSGGEVTEGAYDDSIRHAITKFSLIHFVTANEYRERVIQLGENPDNVFMVGGLGVEITRNLKTLNKKELEKSLSLKFLKKNILVTYHPETIGNKNIQKSFNEVLLALSQIKDTLIIFTLPNFDKNGKIIEKMINEFVNKNPNSYVFKSLGQKRYLSLIKIVDGVLGNSSSGLTEVPAMNKGSINIGNRQNGRIKPKSVIDCNNKKESILNSIRTLYSKEFNINIKEKIKPSNDLKTSQKIFEIIQKSKFIKNNLKKFYDL